MYRYQLITESVIATESSELTTRFERFCCTWTGSGRDHRGHYVDQSIRQYFRSRRLLCDQRL